MDTTAGPAVWPVLIYDDARAAIRFLVDAFGFDETTSYAEEGDQSRVVHAELRWPKGGGVMLGSTGAGSEPFTSLPRGAASTYVVTEEPDGSRGFTVRDPEGNLWSFGTYEGE